MTVNFNEKTDKVFEIISKRDACKKSLDFLLRVLFIPRSVYNGIHYLK